MTPDHLFKRSFFTRMLTPTQLLERELARLKTFFEELKYVDPAEVIVGWGTARHARVLVEREIFQLEAELARGQDPR